MTTMPPPQHAMIRRAVRQLTDRGESSLALWHALAPALGKIIGEAGFESLFFRSLYQAETRAPWLACDARNQASSVAHLTACLATREPAEVDTINIDLLIIFTDTLTVLIGELVTNRILLAAWGALAVLDAPEPTQ